jgi:hypothetical protein
MPISAPKLTPGDPGGLRLGMDRLHPVERERASESSPMPLSKLPWLRPTPRKLKRSVAKPRSTKGLVQPLDDAVVHRPAALRVRVEDHRHRRARARSGRVTAFEAAFGAGKYDGGHAGVARLKSGTGSQVARPKCGAI